MTIYFKTLYDNQAGGEFVGESVGFTELTWAGGGRGMVVQDFPNGTAGKLSVALIAGALPGDGVTLTQGAVTADCDGPASTLLYPAYFRLDVDVTDNAGAKDVRWDTAGGAPVADGNGVLPTHSFFFDGQTADLTVNQTLTFSGGQTAELINIIDQTGADGELEVRFTSNIDAGLPVDGDTFTDEGSGDGTMQGETHPRSYTPKDLHRLLQDLNDDGQIAGDDDLSMLDATASRKDTDLIVRLIGGANVDDTVIDHMYGGSIEQDDGDTKYGGLDFQVTSPNVDSRPVLIQFDETTGLDAIVADYWSTAWNPDSISGNIRIMRKIRENGVDIDGRRVKGKLLEFGDSYFEGGTTLGDATTSLAVFASTDGNNQTAVGTVAGAPYNTIILTEGFQQLDYNNGNGDTDFSLSFDYGSASGAQAYERWKYIQRRGTAEALFGRNAQLATGVNRNFAWDAKSDNLTENEIIAWGTVITYSGQTSNFALGEAVQFSPSGAKGRVLYDNDAGVTGTLLIGDLEGTPTAADTMASIGGGDGDVDSVTINGRAGTGVLIAWDDKGTNGNVYYQATSGQDPLDDQLVYGRSSDFNVTINGAVASRTINNQYVGSYTGTNFQTNFGIGVDPTDAILGDLNRNLANIQQGVPNNQSGNHTNLRSGDRLTAYDWDGSTIDPNGDPVPNFAQLAVSGPVNGASVGTITAQSAIPLDTPATGKIRVENDEGFRILLPYDSWTGSAFTLSANYDFSGAGLNDSVADGNNLTIAYKDETVLGSTHVFDYDNEGGTPPFQVAEILTFGNGATAVLDILDDQGSIGTLTVTMASGDVPADDDTISGGTSGATADINGAVDEVPLSASFTGIYGVDRQMAVTVRRGDSGPIVPFKSSPVFGSTGYAVAAGRQSDA